MVKGIILVVLTLTFARGILAMVNMSLHKNRPAVTEENLKVVSQAELKKHDGSDEKLPIYLAYEGKIYDVSGGRDYYKRGGVYHFLAGKDSTAELNMIGGNIIKRKYPVVGKLE